jgi:hypothetical protein
MGTKYVESRVSSVHFCDLEPVVWARGTITMTVPVFIKGSAMLQNFGHHFFIWTLI